MKKYIKERNSFPLKDKEGKCMPKHAMPSQIMNFILGRINLVKLMHKYCLENKMH
jgi:hypothetical protein